VGILTNLSANHLDRYGNVDEYFGDKAQLFRNASERSVWVSNADDADVQGMVQGVRGHHLRFTTGAGAADGYFDRARNQLVVLGSPLVERGDLVLLGDHNVANALAAALAVMGADEAHRTDDARARVADALRRFRALEHRIEPAGRYADVEWINDSKATNVASTLVALKGMQRPTVLLLGGRHKGEPYTALADELRRTVKLVVAYGEAAPLVAEDLAGVVPVEELGSSFDVVVAHARDAAQPGDAVLLSPACSSYDMFDNYEERGRTFKRLAAELGAVPR
jgi:UDP-N-acetylmuramoylalanine--D-glutamate ligase